jgi:DNA-binding transcriptional LysR family regulator
MRLEREIAVVVAGFLAAVAMARACDLIASVPERHTGSLRAGMHTFTLPFTTLEFTVSLLWHPRFHVDAAHRWLRSLVIETCEAAQ